MSSISSGESLTDSDKAFMSSFKQNFNECDASDEDILDFLCGADKYFNGYTQLADAYNLWADAIQFARGEK